MPTMRALCSIVLALAVTAGCGDSRVAGVEGLTARPGVELTVVHEGIVGPTQLVVLDEGAFLVAAINGGENDGLGQVLHIDPSTGAVAELLGSLDKPTGLAVHDGEMWIMERDRLTRRDLDVDPTGTEADPAIAVGDPEVVADGLPNNGRSEGTLTVTPDGLILFDTSGSKRGATVVEGSGRLFTVDPAERPGQPVELASGFKHAYAHAFDEDGVLWSTEMSDGRFDGELAADEVVAVAPGVDHGWPRCVGDNRPVVEFDGIAAECEGLPSSLVTFEPGASPTSVAVSPFTSNTLLVALWNDGRVVEVNTGQASSVFGDLVTGLSGPQHLTPHDGAVYLTEFGTGRIIRISTP